MIHALAERHARPSNPLASRSRAVLSFHAANRHYPDGDADRARLLDNERLPGALLEARFPVFASSKEPVFVNARNAREAHVHAWIENDKKVRARDMTTITFATSIKCGSVDTDDITETGDLPRFPGARQQCGGMYKLCNFPPGKPIFENYSRAVVTRIPACIKKFNKLDIVDMSSTAIEKLENLETIVTLDDLTVNGTRVNKIEGLDTLVNLTKLWLAGTNVSKIEGLEKLVNLKELQLDRTSVSKIENLDKNTNLEVLWLSGTKVNKIENLDKNVHLVQLFLDDTKVSRIEGLDKNTNLKFIWLNNTSVPDDEKRAFAISRPGLVVI